MRNKAIDLPTYLGHSAKKAVETACELCAFVAQPIIEYKMKYEKEI